MNASVTGNSSPRLARLYDRGRGGPGGGRGNAPGMPVCNCPCPEFGHRARRIGRCPLSEKAPCGVQRRQRCSGQRHCRGLLRQLRAACVDGDRHVQIAWCRNAERALQEYLPWCRREQIRAANDVGDALRSVVDNDGELIRAEAVAAPDDKIAHVLVEPLLLPSVESIGECDRRRRHAHAQGGSSRALRGSVTVMADAIAARSRIHAFANPADRLRGKLVPRAHARVGEAGRGKPGKRRLVRVAARRLAPHGSIPLEAVTFERAQDVVRGARTCTRNVDILDAHEPCAGVAARIGIARHRGNERAEVQRAGRRRREAAAVRAFRRTRGAQCSEAVADVRTAATDVPDS